MNTRKAEGMQIDLEAIRRRESEGWIKSQRHPHLPLTIYNYTDLCQYKRAWDHYTMMCRGLIVDDDGFVVARPFPKFFNLSEYEQHIGPLPDEPFMVQEKMDGSLIIFTLYNGAFVVASRGSFTSEQARWAGAMLVRQSYPDGLQSGLTYLFEYISPENRIVVDYGDERNLYLLAVIDNETGIDQGLSQFDLGFPLVTHYHELHDLRDMPERDNAEGYVIRFASGLRVKVKHEEYVRLHRIVTGLTEKAIWERLKNGESVMDDLDGVPDELYEWAQLTEHKIMDRWFSLEEEAREAFFKIEAEAGPDASRKNLALAIQRESKELQPILFAFLSGKDHEPILWKAVKPASPTSKNLTGS